MLHRHRAGISLGLVITVLGGGAFGYFVGRAVPDGVFGLSGTAGAITTGLITAIIAGLVWSIGEAIVGVVGVVDKDATMLRLWISLIGSFLSVMTAGLDLFGIHLFGGLANSHSIFSYGPIASGLGSIAIGAHALLHQLHLDRDQSRR